MPMVKDSSKPQLIDESLDALLQCNWKPIAAPDVRYQLGIKLVRWAFLECLQGAIPELRALQEKYAFFWHEIWRPRPREGEEYRSVIREAAPLARRLYEFLLQYEVIDPLRRYTVRLPSGIVIGRAAIVRKRLARGLAPPLALDLLDKMPRSYLIPSARGLARWLGMRDRSDEVSIGLVHLPLRQGKPWTESYLNEALAKQSLDSMLKAIAGSLYPRPGNHCRTCSAPCKEIFNGSNDYRRTGWATILTD